MTEAKRVTVIYVDERYGLDSNSGRTAFVAVRTLVEALKKLDYNYGDTLRVVKSFGAALAVELAL